MTDVGDRLPSDPVGGSLPVLTIELVSLFPRIFDSWLQQGVVSRAVERGIVHIELLDLRPFGIGRHHVTDDYPFGGGPGMVMKPEPVFAAIEAGTRPVAAPIILLSPRGRRFDQQVARDLSGVGHFVLLAGHYEGVDERICSHLVTDELSLGDFVLSAGELAAMAVVDATVRLLPGALAEASIEEESFGRGLLEYPQYTRPASFRGWETPAVLLGGNHAEIARWRRKQALLTTVQRRPDLLVRAELTLEERRLCETELNRGKPTLDTLQRDD